MTVGSRIRQARLDKGLTQNELGQKLGISGSAVGQFEKANATLRTDTIQKIAQALDIPSYELLMSEGEKLKAIRESKGITVDELGNEVGLTGSQIAQIESQDARASNELLSDLADALGVSRSLFFSGTVAASRQTSQNEVSALEVFVQRVYHSQLKDKSEAPDVYIDKMNNADDYFYFTEDKQEFAIKEKDFKDLFPLVDGLVHAYIEQKKLACVSA